MFCASKKIPGQIWNLQWGCGLHVEGNTVYVGFLESYPEIRVLIKTSWLTSLPVEFCGMLPETWTLSVTLYSDSEASARKRQNDCDVLGEYALETESVDLVASVLTILSMVFPSACSPPHQSPEAHLLGTLKNRPMWGDTGQREEWGLGSAKLPCLRAGEKSEVIRKKGIHELFSHSLALVWRSWLQGGKLFHVHMAFPPPCTSLFL